MKRVGTCNVNEFMKTYKKEHDAKIKDRKVFNKAKFSICGYDLKLKSLRYQTFLATGLKCTRCGLKASLFAFEKNEITDKPHANPYGLLKDGTEIMFTKDHIIPSSRGGKNRLDNFQTMCKTCNTKKGNKLEQN